ncbi:MAG: circularly permuted type 2 ATP-grasp protein [Propionibacteriaceae bacterium]
MTAGVQPVAALAGYAKQVDPRRSSLLADPEEARPFDELVQADGAVRPAWQRLVPGLDELAGPRLRSVVSDVARLLEDDGVTYTPNPAAVLSIAEPSAVRNPDPVIAEPRPWRLDPIPLLLQAPEWLGIERGLVQRAELLDAVLTDLYGDQQLLASGALPATAILGHQEYLRPAVGVPLAARRLFLLAADLGRDSHGDWSVTSDRTQAPSGAGYALQNRRIISRALPELYRESRLQRLTPFFHALRMALVDASPGTVEDPRVVVLSPGTRSETAFDQAFLASLLGFPLLQGSDLTVRDGRVWMRVLGKLEQVDVILRRLDAAWADPLELRSGSRLGVAGLLECVRRGTVNVVNALGSGVLENPALMPFLPRLCRELLGEELRLPSVQTHWCGEEESRRYVITHLDSLVIRAISRGHGRSVVGSALTAHQRDELVAAIQRRPYRYVGQELLSLSSTPTQVGDQLVPRPVVLRSFAVRRGSSYTAMLGGLARVADSPALLRGSLVGTSDGWLSKDVWVVSGADDRRPDAVPSGWLTDARFDPDRRAGELAPPPVPEHQFAMVPRVLDDLYWFGRYAERAEDLLRLILAARAVAVETDGDVLPGHALALLLTAVTEVSGTYPGFTSGPLALRGMTADQMNRELCRVLLDRTLRGSVAHSVAALQTCALGIRDQISNDVWMVLAGVERALTTLLLETQDRGSQLIDTSERVLSGLLALAGITSENMVRDPGWYLMDGGRGLERALQLLALLRHTVCDRRDHLVGGDSLVVEAVLTASESIVTFRRRYRGHAPAEALVGLLVLDAGNPRSVRFQVDRIIADLTAVPSDSSAPRPLRLAEEIVGRLVSVDVATLVVGVDGTRPTLAVFLDELRGSLRALSRSLGDYYFTLPPSPQPLATQAPGRALDPARSAG